MDNVIGVYVSTQPALPSSCFDDSLEGGASLAARYSHLGKNVVYTRVCDVDGTIYPSGKNHNGDDRFKAEKEYRNMFTDAVARSIYNRFKSENHISNDPKTRDEERIKYVLTQDILRSIVTKRILLPEGTNIGQFVQNEVEDLCKKIADDPEEKAKILDVYKGVKGSIMRQARADFDEGVKQHSNFATVCQNMGVDSMKAYEKVVARLPYHLFGYAPGTDHRHSSNVAFESLLQQEDGVQNYVWTNSVPWHAAHVIKGMGIDPKLFAGVFANWEGDLGKNPCHGTAFDDEYPWGEDKLVTYGGPLKTENGAFELLFDRLKDNNPDADVIVVQAFENTIENLKDFKEAAAYYSQEFGINFVVEAIGLNWDGDELAEEYEEIVERYFSGPYALVDFVEEELGIKIDRSLPTQTPPVLTSASALLDPYELTR